MNNDVLLVPVQVEQPNLEAQSDVFVYVPQAHKDKLGIVKEGEGIKINRGTVSLDKLVVENMIDANKWVSYGFKQNLTEDEKGIARHNIGAGANEFTGSWLDLANRPQETIDFAEEERLKGKNLLFLKNHSATTGGVSVSVSGEDQTITFNGTSSQWSSVNIRIPLSLKLKKNIKYSFTYKAVQGFSANFPVIMGRYAGTPPFTFTAAEDEEITSMTLTIPANTHFVGVVSAYQVEKGEVSTSYAPAVGDIMRQNDAPIRFVETERLKSENNNYILHIDNVDDALNKTSKEPVQNKVLYEPVTFAETERQKSKNLFNKDEVILNTWIVNGVVVPSNGYFTTNYIKIDGQQYTVSATSLTSGSTQAFYDANKNYLKESPLSTFTGTNYDVPANAVYVRSNYKIEELNNNIQYEIGTQATSYQPYNGAITHNGDAPVVFAKSERQKTLNLCNNELFEWGDIVSQGKVEQSSTIVIRTKNYIQVKPNTQYFIGVGQNSVSVGLKYYSSKSLSSAVTTKDLSGNGVITIPDGCYYVRICSKMSDGSVKITKQQFYLYEGTTDHGYLEYNGAITHEKQVNEALKSRELLYQHDSSNVIDISESTLTELQDFCVLFNQDPFAIYKCYKNPDNNPNFHNLIGNPSTSSTYQFIYVKLYALGISDYSKTWCPYRVYEVFAMSSQQVIAHKYFTANNNSKFSQTDWLPML